jgi:hypothetical protein
VKPLQFKIWPEVTGYLPFLGRFQSQSGNSSQLVLDFSGCKRINSCGLTAVLLKAIYAARQQSLSIAWQAEGQRELSIFPTLRGLDFVRLLEPYVERTLFDEVPDNVARECTALSQFQFGGREIISFPILHLGLGDDKSDRRGPLRLFKKILIERLTPFESKFAFKLNQFLMILNEIAKNSADHTVADAYFGMDIEISPRNEEARLSFFSAI